MREEVISRKTVQHIAKLARLSLSEQEEELYTKQLGNILQHFEDLKAIDTTGVEPMSHALPVSNIMREDILVESPGHAAVLEGAPDSEKAFFRVPKIGD